MRLKAAEKFARAIDSNTDEAVGLGVTNFKSYDYVKHLISDQLVGL